MIDKVKFYACIRTNGLFTVLTQKQVDSIDALLNECEAQGLTNVQQVAYVLATPYHECYNPKKPETRITPIKEFGSVKYLTGKKYWPYIGRGFSGLTWLANYKKEGKRLGLDLINNPDLILDIPTAANSHVYCMIHGTYAGKKLSDYINDTKCDFINARRIINGTDKAELIMSYAQKFLNCLSHSSPSLSPTT